MGEAKRRNKKPSRFRGKGKFAVTVIVISIAIVSVYDYFQRINNPPLNRNVPARTIGTTDAKFQVVEFIDMQCQDCARGARILKMFMQQYPDDIQLSIKFFPLEEMNSMVGAIHAECAAQQDKFWPFHDELIAKQNQWRLMRDVAPFLKSLAKNTGLTMEPFEQCIENEATREIVEHEKRLGEAYFVKSTPTYFINEKMYVGVEEMQKYLAEYYENKRLGLL